MQVYRMEQPCAGKSIYLKPSTSTLIEFKWPWAANESYPNHLYAFLAPLHKKYVTGGLC